MLTEKQISHLIKEQQRFTALKSKLKSCPFCGQKELEMYMGFEYKYALDAEKTLMFTPMCTHDYCGVQPHIVEHKSLEEAIAAWNTRRKPLKKTNPNIVELKKDTSRNVNLPSKK